MPSPRPGAGHSSDWDVVVVGAGHNGLVAANLLADAGLRVCVLEATDRPGGAVGSRRLGSGHVVDLFSAFYPLGRASPVLQGLGLDRFGLRWAHAPLVLAHALPDGRTIALSRDLDETCRELDAHAPGDGAAWRGLLHWWMSVERSFLRSVFSPFPPVRSGLALARIGPRAGLRLARLALMSAWRFAEEELTGEPGQLLLLGNSQHADISPHGAGSAVFGWALSMLGQRVGHPVPVGGAQRLADALADRLLAAGGSIAYSTPVSALIVEDGVATGAVDQTGAEYRAGSGVVADVPAPVLYLDLVGARHLPASLVADLSRFQWDPPTLKVDWALDAPIPWSSPTLRRAGTVHLGVDRAGLADYANDLAVGREPSSPFVLLGQMSTSDPTRSPPGTESVWGYTHLPVRLATDGEVLDRQVARMEQSIEDLAPGFRQRVVHRLVQRPADLQAANPALALGAVNGGTAALHQQLVFRPVPGLGRAETPVDRLYLGGASAHPGGGVHGACGANAARAVLRRRSTATRPFAATAHRLARHL